MDILYPRIPRHRLWPMARIALLGAVIAGAYGAVHDQISYSISPEYFTKLKFDQFRWADFGWPKRVFASEVGFLASWWVGLIAGWFLARIGLVDLTESAARYPVIKAFAIVAVAAVIVGEAGFLLGVEANHREPSSTWRRWGKMIGVEEGELPKFAVVAYLHLASYVGAVLGLIAAAVYVRRSLSKTRQHVASTAIETDPPIGTCSSPQRGGRQ